MNTVELLKQIYSDPNALPGHLHPEFKLHAPGQNRVAGEFAGLDGLMTHLGAMQDLSGGTMKLDAHTFLADETWGMVISHVTAERDGKKLDAQGFGVWRFQDGKLIDHWENTSDQAHWDDFWS